MTMTAQTRTVKLVRLRDGVDVFGRKVEKNGRSGRLWHLVRMTADLDSPDAVTTCCGLEFAPGTLVEVPWIESLPHGLCLRRSPWPRWKVEADYMAANVVPKVEELPAGWEVETRAILDVLPEVVASIAAATRILEKRPGWVQDSSGVPTWEYAESFKGVLVGEKRFPRNHDLGLFALTAEVVKPGGLRIRSCGVIGGCSFHGVRSEEVPLDNAALIDELLGIAERRARTMGLERLSWCLIVGPCSAHPTHAPVPEIENGARQAAE
jgi:hypothetical protein